MSNVTLEIGEDGDYYLLGELSGVSVKLMSFPAYDIDVQIGAAVEAARNAPAPQQAPTETPAPAEAPAVAEAQPEPAAAEQPA